MGMVELGLWIAIEVGKAIGEAIQPWVEEQLNPPNPYDPHDTTDVLTTGTDTDNPYPATPATPTTPAIPGGPPGATGSPPILGTPNPESPIATLPGAGTTGTDIPVPSANDLAVAQAELSASQISQYREKAGFELFTQMVRETQIESTIKASSAQRGLRFEGSPLMQLKTQQQASKTVVGEEKNQMAATAASMQNQANIQYGQFLNAQSLDIYYYNQAQSNLWLNAFSSIMGMGTSFLNTFWR